MLAGDAEKVCNLGFCPAGCWNHILPQQGGGMGRTTIRITLGNMTHDDFTCVIWFQVDAPRVAIFDFERDAARDIYMDRIAGRFEVPQGMEIKAVDIHFLGSYDDVKPVHST